MAAPTNAQLQLAIVNARAYSLSWDDIAEIVKTGIAFAQLNGSLEAEFTWSSVNSDGTSVTRMSMLDAVKFYQLINNLNTGGIVAQYCEFQR